MKTQLTASESAKLIELGVSPGKANGVWLPGTDAIIPFTLTDILDILPREVKCEDLEIGFCGEDWCAAYDEIMVSIAPELIDALYSLLLRCLEKGYVKLD